MSVKNDKMVLIIAIVLVVLAVGLAVICTKANIQDAQTTDTVAGPVMQPSIGRAKAESSISEASPGSKKRLEVKSKPVKLAVKDKISETPAEENVEKTEEAQAVTPANALPTDEEIERSIIEQNSKRQIMEALLAKREEKASNVRAEIDQMSPAQLSPQEPTQEMAPPSTPPAELVQKVKDRTYVIN